MSKPIMFSEPMTPPVQPSNEHERVLHSPSRLAALHRLALIDVPVQPLFDDIAHLAAKLLLAPAALIGLVDRERQFFVSSVGLSEPWASARQTPLSHSFCQYIVAKQQPLRVDDTRNDPLLSQNKAINELNVTSYLGVPLFFDQQPIGALCVIDHTMRHWSDNDQHNLEALANLVMREFHIRVLLAELHIDHARLTEVESVLRAEANGDSLTGLPNRRAFDSELEARCRLLGSYTPNIVLALLDIDYFKQINDRFGHPAGDCALKALGAHLQRFQDNRIMVFRVGGEEFAILLDHPPSEAHQILERIRQSINTLEIHCRETRIPAMTASLGLSAYHLGDTPQRWFQRADDALYNAKRGGRNMIVAN